MAGFTCFCPPGLTGAVCEINIDDCDVSYLGIIKRNSVKFLSVNLYGDF